MKSRDSIVKCPFPFVYMSTFGGYSQEQGDILKSGSLYPGDHSSEDNLIITNLFLNVREDIDARLACYI